MARHRLWVLNFDAEDEMANATATSSDAVRARFDALAARVGPLLGDGDVLHREGLVTDGLEGRAWCPTPRAARAWARAEAMAPVTPAFEIIRRVNHRAFCASLGPTLPGAAFLTTRDEVLHAVSARSPTDQWLLKRPYGYAGRGRKKVRRGVPDAATLAWIDASLARDGLQVEPWVERQGDFGLHGFIARDGTVTLGEPTVQTLDARGAWEGSVRVAPDALAPSEHAALTDAARSVAEALVRSGYFGPFGIDAFRWIQAGVIAFRACAEINARYSMGWAVGMGDRRPDL